MTLFRNDIHRDLWIDTYCHTCFQPDEAQRRLLHKDTQCPIQKHALTTGRKPREWDRNTRTTEMLRSIRCNSYQPRPPRAAPRLKTVYLPGDGPRDGALFDIDHDIDQAIKYVPVDGWPDQPDKPDEPEHQ